MEEFNQTQILTLRQVEKDHILSVLGQLGGNKTKAASALGITVKTLYNKLHSYGVPVGKPSVASDLEADPS